MRTSFWLIVCLALAFGSGCKKKQPSQDFTDASQAFASLYGAKLDAAYLDPRMDGILEQLRRVPADSTDTEAARALISRIEEGRATAQREAAARADAKAKALTPEVVPFNPERAEDKTVQQQQTPPPMEEVKDAGPNRPIVPRDGMSIADFEKYFGDCFEMGPTIYLGGAGSGPSDSKVLRDYNRCKDALPGFDQKFVLFQNGLLVNIMDKSVIQTVTLGSDGGIVDGGQ